MTAYPNPTDPPDAMREHLRGPLTDTELAAAWRTTPGTVKRARNLRGGCPNPAGPPTRPRVGALRVRIDTLMFNPRGPRLLDSGGWTDAPASVRLMAAASLADMFGPTDEFWDCLTPLAARAWLTRLQRLANGMTPTNNRPEGPTHD